jgi:PHD-like zinc-binding domain
VRGEDGYLLATTVDMSEKGSAALLCHLCLRGSEDRDLGPLILNVIQKKAFHFACILYTSGVWVNPDSGRFIYNDRTVRALESASTKFDVSCGFNGDCFPHMDGFDTAVTRAHSLQCYACKKNRASIGCSRADCPRSFHIPCAAADREKSIIFHARMIYYGAERRLRPGRFYICRHHAQWEQSDSWSALRHHIQDHPELLAEGVSVDVNRLPLTLQQAVMDASQLVIFDPDHEKNKTPGELF